MLGCEDSCMNGWIDVLDLIGCMDDGCMDAWMDEGMWQKA